MSAQKDHLGTFLLKTRQMIIISLKVSAYEQTRFIYRPSPSCPFLPKPKSKTIKDVLGREVKVDVPVKRAVLAFYYPDYIAVTGADKF